MMSRCRYVTTRQAAARNSIASGRALDRAVQSQSHDCAEGDPDRARPRRGQEGQGHFRYLTELTGFVEDMQTLGRHATARLLDKRIVTADEAVAHHVALAPGALVVRLRRVRLADGVAVSFDETYLPRDIGEKVAGSDLEAEPVFSLPENRYDTPLVEAEYKLEAAAADPDAARALQVPTGSPIFLIERTSYTIENRPVDYERLHYRGDLIRFVTRLARRPRT
jgi:GntR family transcriptional regulator